MSNIQSYEDNNSSKDNELLQQLPPDVQKDIEGIDDPRERSAVLKYVEKSISYEAYRGPIPPATMLKEYEEILPGAADRIIGMAEKQSTHRHEIETIAIKSKARSEVLGVIFAGLIALFALVGGIFLIVSGLAIEGFVSILTPLGCIVGAFIYGTRSEKAERAEKRKQRDS